MTVPRRIGAEDSESRRALLDAALQLMVEEGYAAVTSRKLAAKAGLKPQLVHYYFRTMDDLFIALVRRGAEQNLERQARALASPQPLRALWEFMNHPSGTILTMEFSALANHRKAIKAETKAYAEQFRKLQSEALGKILEGYGVDTDAYPPEAVSLLMNSITQVLGMERALGMKSGHAELKAVVERFIAEYE